MWSRNLNAPARMIFGGALAGLGLSACDLQAVDTQGLRPEGPVSVSVEEVDGAGESGLYFVLSPAAYGVAYDGVLARLAAAGIGVSAQDWSAGTIEGEIQSNDTIDCGEIVVQDGEVSRRVPGNVALSVVPEDGGMGRRFTRRELSNVTRFRIDVAPRADGPGTVARINETHTVRLELLDIIDQRARRYEESFSGNTIVAFSDGTTCTSSGALRRIVR